MDTFVQINIYKERMKFSAGHFTIFSETERENLHGHNFSVKVSFTAKVMENGFVCDYGILKKAIEQICNTLDETFLLPTQSPYLTIEEQDSYIWAHFADEKIPFLRRDVTLLPVRNATVEELARWFLYTLQEQILLDERRHGELIWGIEATVASGPGQEAMVSWKK